MWEVWECTSSDDEYFGEASNSREEVPVAEEPELIVMPGGLMGLERSMERELEEPVAPEMPAGIFYRCYESRYEQRDANDADVEEETEEQEVAIGLGRTTISKERFKKIRWDTFDTATRTLLVAIFPKRVLATHSVTGRPYVPNRSGKPLLNPIIVEDIVAEVTRRYLVSPTWVRMVIIAKCFEEFEHAAYLRQRQREMEEQARRRAIANRRAFG